MAVLKYKDKNGNFVVLPTGGGSGSYELPIASAETLGGIKIGENLTITEDGTLNAEASSSAILSPGAVIYDEQERMIGRWTDGRPLYQKTIVYEGESVSASTVYNHNINNLNKVVNAHVIAKRTGNNMWETYNISQSNQCARFTVNNTEIRVSFINGGWDPYDILLITLQYTKTTDEPNSFRPNMIENISIMRNLDFSNIYSTEEKVVGCWIDGRPIYQKMLYFTIPNTTGNINYDTGIKNISTCINMNLSIQGSDGKYTKFCHAIWADQATIIEDSFLTTGIIQYYIKGTYWADATARAILQYTKTTDVENSFTVDMLTDYENITDAEIEAAAAADKI